MSRSWSIWSAGAALAVLTGCATAAQPGPAPASAPVTASASPAGPPAYYTGLTGDCPVLRSPESVRFTGSRTGTHFPIPRQLTGFDRIDCGWRPASDEPPWVTIAVTIFLEPATAHEKAERQFTRARDESTETAKQQPEQAHRAVERATPHGPAIVVADARDSEITGGTDDLSQTTLAGNAVVVVSLFEKRDPARAGAARSDELIKGLTATSEAITAEIVEQLVRRA
jgi:hypothetical protein